MKDTKILIPEIPKEWTQRIRSGHTNIFSGNKWIARSSPRTANEGALMGAREQDVTCYVCDTDFKVEIKNEPRYTSSLKKFTTQLTQTAH